ncbi:XRE family transcriptional regulator [Agrobacterium sp. FDAARGOS_525]|nr:XRE family transcriptional regulator [Agrobacterium sp. FDAARGOS_525]
MCGVLIPCLITMNVEMKVGDEAVIMRRVTTVGPQIRYARIARNMGQADVADALGVTVQAVSQWERDETTPSGLNLLKLHKLLALEIPSNLAGLEAVHLADEALPENEAREGGSHATPSRVSELLEYTQEIHDLLHALDKMGDGIGGADGFAVSAVALSAKSIADNVAHALQTMGAE